LPECEPGRKEQLEWTDVERIITEAAASGVVKTVCFTGGEPFLRRKLLQDAIALCARRGLEATVMTNGYWAPTLERALKVLRSVPGLTRLGLSADTFHQEFIPMDRIRFAILAANELEMDCAVRVCHLDEPDREIEWVRGQLLDVAGLYELEHQPVQPMGRAADEVPANRIFHYDVTIASCRSADAHAVNAEGDVTACCGASSYWQGHHPLWFGNVKEHSIDEILANADANPALHLIRLRGPAGLLALAEAQAQREGTTLVVPETADMCGLCEYLNSDPERAALVQRAVNDPETYRAIAVARFVDFGEPSMLNLVEAASRSPESPR
jgi:MoaA/NifB/PqqE/SkfB family radical SAM enzyme